METKIKNLVKKVLNEGIEYIEPESSSCDCSKQIKQALVQLTINREELKRNPNSDNEDFLAMLTKIEKILNNNITEGEDDDSEDEPKSSGGGGDAGQNLKKETDLVLTPVSADIDTVVSALENMDNYGMYLSNLRNTKAGLQKAIDDHFGPSTPMVKRGLEKKRGKPFAIKSKQAIDDFIKSFSKNTNILSYDVEGNTVRFPSGENATPATLKNIIKTVMDKAGIKYKLDSKENLNEDIWSAHSPNDEEFKLASDYAKSKGLHLHAIGVNRDGSINGQMGDKNANNLENFKLDKNGKSLSKENLSEQYKKAKKIQRLIKEALQEKEQIPGGLAKGKTLQQIADHHKIHNSFTFNAQLRKGIKVEMEHTTDPKIAKEIAMDHLWEDPNYYTKLNKMEKGDLKEDESLFKIDSGLAFKIYNILKSEFPEITKKYPLASSFFYSINEKL